MMALPLAVGRIVVGNQLGGLESNYRRDIDVARHAHNGGESVQMLHMALEEHSA
jgi:hypothetical protein